jgi:uridylate kinase
VVIFAAGTGNPFMTTDTAGALRAIETDCEALLMAKNGVDGVYNADPAKDPTATKYDHVTYLEAIQRRLQVMDITALSMCMEHQLPIIVFDVAEPDAVFHALRGDRIGTLVSSDPEGETPPPH